ncbi:hypothetical protein E2562_032128 [Oryza meyeriana var. granulata]|uniref:Uncharacterized protein n=1 Tax=Oryza meyeriana var. granulata TaxID=110450 RepID=A0A6G1CLQ0_9ORYZ|nr:hypothetical protein E2562_032128 [Oryza meyeriana var. granulata]
MVAAVAPFLAATARALPLASALVAAALLAASGRAATLPALVLGGCCGFEASCTATWCVLGWL